MVNTVSISTGDENFKSGHGFDGPSTKLNRLFFTRTDSTVDIRPGFIPEEDFSDTYTDWKLDEEVEAFRKEHPQKYESIVARLDAWFADHYVKLLNFMYHTFENENVDFKTFKKVLLDLNVPASDFERHLLCLLLDSGRRKCISLRNFERSLKDYHRIVLEDEDKKEMANQLVDDDVFIRMNLVSYENAWMLSFKGNFRVLVRHDMYVGGLINLIQKRVPLIYRDFEFHATLASIKEGNKPLSHSLTLVEAGLRGGPFHQPVEKFMFYIMNFYYPCSSLLLYKSYETEKRERRKFIEQDITNKTEWWENKKIEL